MNCLFLQLVNDACFLSYQGSAIKDSDFPCSRDMVLLCRFIITWNIMQIMGLVRIYQFIHLSCFDWFYAYLVCYSRHALESMVYLNVSVELIKFIAVKVRYYLFLAC